MRECSPAGPYVMASTRAPRRWQTPSTRSRMPGRSATSTDTRVTEEGATPGGRSIMEIPDLAVPQEHPRRVPHPPTSQRTIKARGMGAAGLANDDGDDQAGGAA